MLNCKPSLVWCSYSGEKKAHTVVILILCFGSNRSRSRKKISVRGSFGTAPGFFCAVLGKLNIFIGNNHTINERNEKIKHI